MPNIASFLKSGITYLSNGESYVVIDTATNERFKIYNVHAQQTSPEAYQRAEANTTGSAYLTFNVAIKRINRILAGQNQYIIEFQGFQYIITEALNQVINGYMSYRAELKMA